MAAEYIDINRYLNLESGASPYIEAIFNAAGGKYKYDTLTSPYITNLSVTDQGYREIELKMFDKDFGLISSADHTPPLIAIMNATKTGNGTAGKNLDSAAGSWSINYKIYSKMIKWIKTNEKDLENYGSFSGRDTKVKNVICTFYLHGSTVASKIHDVISKSKLATVKPGSSDEQIKAYQEALPGYIKALAGEILLIFYDLPSDDKFPSLIPDGEYLEKAIEDMKGAIQYICCTTSGLDDQINSLAEIDISDIAVKIPLAYSTSSGDVTENLTVRFGYADYNGKVSEINKQLLYNDTYEKDKYSGKLYAEPDKNPAGTLFSGYNQNIIRSPEINCIITGFEYNFTTEGIEMTVKAIEASTARTVGLKFVQQYASIIDTPSGILKVLRNSFDSIHETMGILYASPNQPLKNSEGKYLVYTNDSVDKGESSKNKVASIGLKIKNGFYQEIDDEVVKQRVCENNGVENIEDLGDSSVWLEKLEEERDYGISYGEKSDFQKIELSLGGEDSWYNTTNEVDKKKVYYKSFYSLLNEFCEAAPAKPITNTTLENAIKAVNNGSGVADNDGNDMSGELESSRSAKLKWTSFIIDKSELNNSSGSYSKYLYIKFYYEEQSGTTDYFANFSKIRRYNWGPGFGGNTSVTNITFTNKCLFGLIAAGFDDLSAIDLEKNEVLGKSGDGSVGVNTPITEKNKIVCSDLSTNSKSLNVMKNSFDNSVVEGTVEMLGDPGLCFDIKSNLYPFCFPIYLGIYVPVTEFMYQAMSNHQPAIENEFSGLYVVKKFTHSISSEGFFTKMDIMRYPGLESKIRSSTGGDIKSPTPYKTNSIAKITESNE